MACADEGSEQRKVNRGTENIGMNLFPPSFISDIVVTIFVVSSAEASIILSQGSHENHGYQANQENNHHEGIKYREPVYLNLGGLVTIIEKHTRVSYKYLVLKEALVKVFLEPLLERSVGLLPCNGIGKLQSGSFRHWSGVLRSQVDLDNLLGRWSTKSE